MMYIAGSAALFPPAGSAEDQPLQPEAAEICAELRLEATVNFQTVPEP